MKKIFSFAAFLFAVVLFPAACTDLDEEVYTEIPLDGFFKSEKEVLMYAGRSYAKLQRFPEEQRLWSLIENASDEMVIPGRDDGLWWEQGRWDELHTHHFSATNKILRQSWEFVFEGITACNEVIYVTEESDIQFDGKERVVGEIKILRALFYYWAIDNWGNVPFTIDFTDKELPEQKDRKFIFSFIEKEILDNVELLQDQPSSAYYGRVTQGMAYTLLARLYLNAAEWIGESKYQEAVDACDKVIGQGFYHIEDDYFANFKVHNEGSVENIFVIPNHSVYTKDRLYWYTLTLNDASRATFGFKGEMWDGFVLEPDFFNKYAVNDLRRNSFLYGQQYDMNGNPVYFIENNDTVWFEYTPTIANYRARKRWEGARCCKYEYQKELEYYVTDMENDFVIFRYADVLYTKLEALWRLGRAGEILGDPELQKIRTRAGMPVYNASEITAEELLDEFGREFAWEARRRQDQIRFGVWGSTWWNKPASGATAKLFPIPQTALSANSKIKQNDGY
ncbi:MAG: RagB/SusD family nutrient uptake outer membrane protein [Bacteroidales bacterium]|nr:RagB/SusD family nutrient uptake outer membrane protein [Bacteroidales bacterium]